MSALQASLLSWKRACGSLRAYSTRARMFDDGSLSRLPESLSKSTRGTSTWMSMRSSTGPLMRFW